jgi:hypothetical protein
MYSGGAMIDQIQDSTITGTPVTNTFSRPDMGSGSMGSMDSPPSMGSPPPMGSMGSPPPMGSMGSPPMDSPPVNTMDNTSTTATDGGNPPVIEDDAVVIEDDAVDVVRPPPPPPPAPKDESYAQEYSIFFIIYILIGFMYMIHSGVDLPTELNNWLYKNPHYINMTLSTLYFALSIVYITYFHPKKESKNGEMYRRFIAFAIVATIMMGWYKIYQKESTSMTSDPIPLSATQPLGF